MSVKFRFEIQTIAENLKGSAIIYRTVCILRKTASCHVSNLVK